MDGVFLGKIVKAEFGFYDHSNFLMGLELQFRFDGNSGVSTSGSYMINISEECKWDNELQKNAAYQKVLKELAGILKDAKVSHVSQLAGKPIEITIKNRTYESFRILTEVL